MVCRGWVVQSGQLEQTIKGPNHVQTYWTALIGGKSSVGDMLYSYGSSLIARSILRPRSPVIKQGRKGLGHHWPKYESLTCKVHVGSTN